MRKRNLMGKIFGIALTCFMVGSMVGGLPGAAVPFGGFACQSQALAQEVKTWYVDDDLADYPNADFIRIQDAVDAASAGDTIVVYPGTYIENVDVDKSNLTIKSQSGAGSTIVQAANSNDHVFEVRAHRTVMNYVVISGFTVKGAIGDIPYEGKDGIYLYDAYHCNISNNKASNNFVGISLDCGDNNAFLSNIASNNVHCGIATNYANHNTLILNIVSNNKIGIGLDGCSSYNTLSRNTVSNNNCGIWSVDVWPGKDHNSFYYNTISYNSYGISLEGASSRIYLNNFIGNANQQHEWGKYGKNFWDSPEKITYVYSGKTYTNYLGNHWDDYTGSDASRDGIGDSPYPIDSEIGLDEDSHPLMAPFEDYEIGSTFEIDDIIAATVYLHVRDISDWNNPLDPNNLIFTMHPPAERAKPPCKPPYDVGKIIDGPKTDDKCGYTWWKIKWDNGEIGWSAEAPLDNPSKKWLVKSDKRFIKMQDLEDAFNYQGDYESDESKLKPNEVKALPTVTKYANKYHISLALIMAIIRQESDFNSNAKGDYWGGEYHSFGYMQVSYGAATDTYTGYIGDKYKGTKQQWKTDGLDPETNIKYGTRYLRIQHDRIKDGCSGYEDVYGDIPKSTISAYNAGHPTLANRMCYMLGGRCDGAYTGVIEGKLIDDAHRGYKFFLFTIAWDPWNYDENKDGKIQKMEAIHAVQDYFDGKITKAQAIEVVMLYFG